MPQPRGSDGLNFLRLGADRLVRRRLVLLQKILDLLLQRLDFILWEDTLKGYSIKGDGSVELGDEAMQHRLNKRILWLGTGEDFPEPARVTKA